MNCKNWYLLACVVGLLGIGNPAHAHSLCEGLRIILADARNSFSSLRLEFNFLMDEYRGKVTLGPLDECATSSDKGVAEYQCKKEGLPDDENYVKAELLRLESEMQKCLGNDIKRKRGSQTRVTYEYLPSNDELSLQYGRIVPRKGSRPPFYYLAINVTLVDLNR